MIPKGTAYKTTTVSRFKNKANVEEYLNKFNIKDILWKESDPKESYLIFKKVDENNNNAYYKIEIPFIQKDVKGVLEFHEERAYAYLWHIFKAMMNQTDIGMAIEEVFLPNLVIDKAPDGHPITVKDKANELRAKNGLPQLELR